MRKWRHSKFQWFVRGHTAGVEWGVKPSPVAAICACSHLASGSQTAWCSFGKALVITLTSLLLSFPLWITSAVFPCLQLLHSLPWGLCTLSFAYSASSPDITMTNFHSFLKPLFKPQLLSGVYPDPARKITPSAVHLFCFHSFLLETYLLPTP